MRYISWIRFFIGFLLAMVGFNLTTQGQENVPRTNINGPEGLQVNSFTGNLFTQREDLFIPGRGLSLDFVFSYNSSLSQENRGLGYGWTFPYGICYIQDSLGVIILKEDGRKDLYVNSGGSFVSPSGVYDDLTQIGVGQYKLTMNDGMTYFFEDATHRCITRIVDRYGNTISLTYTNNYPSTITDPTGRDVSLTWTDGLLTEISHDLLDSVRTYTYTYDDNQNLIQFTNAEGGQVGYTYDDSHHLSSLTDENGGLVTIGYTDFFAVNRMISCFTDQRINYNSANRTTYHIDIVNGENQITTYRYDEEGRLLEQEGNCCGYNVKYEYDDLSNVVRKIDANGGIYTFTYDDNGNVLTETDPLGNTRSFTYEPNYNLLASYIDKAGNASSYFYNANGDIIQENMPEGISLLYTYDAHGLPLTYTDGEGNLTSNTYNTNGYLATYAMPEGGVTSYVYDEVGNVLSITDPNGHTTTFTYDVEDRMVSTTDPLGNVASFSYDQKGNRTQITDANGNIYQFTYDALDRLILMEDPIGGIHTYTYDARSNIIGYTDPNGHITRYEYDKRNLPIRMINAVSDVYDYNYDGNGNLVSLTMPNGNVFTMTYDAYDRPLKVSDQEGDVLTYTYDSRSRLIASGDGEGNVTTYAYDGFGRLTSALDPLGNAITYQYDRRNNIISYTNRKGNTTTYTYDGDNRLTQAIDPLGFTSNYTYDSTGNVLTIQDPNQEVTTYIYDPLNRVTSQNYPDGTSQIFTYDPEGNRLTRTDNNGNIISYTYDPLDRLTRKDFANGTFHSFAYDGVDNIISAISPDAVVTMAYDALNRPISETLNGITSSVQYDVPGSKRILNYPGGRTIEEQMDGRGRLLRVFDQASPANPLALFSYDQTNRTIRKEFRNGTFTNFGYDGNSRLVSLEHFPSNLAKFSLSYDNENNLVEENWLHQNTRSERFAYDDINRIIDFKRGTLSGGAIPSPISDIQYNYDGVGNRTAINENGTSTTYTTNPVNQYTGILGLVSLNPTYDNNGNLTSDGQQTFQFDQDNKLISIDNGATGTYLYDAFGRRTRKITATDTTDFFYFFSNVWEERAADGTVKASYVFGHNMDEVLSMTRNNQDYYFHYNGSGSVVQLTDVAGNVVEQYEYDPYGRVSFYDGSFVSMTGSAVGNSYLFTGRRYDAESGLYYYRNRYYSPDQGRFVQRDPLGYIDGLSLYQYVLSNPRKYVDPLGLAAGPCGGGDPPLDFWDFVPVVGSARDAFRAAAKGNYLEAALHTALAISDIPTGGAGAVAKGAAKGAAKAAAKAAAREAAEAAAKRGAREAAERASREAAEQAARRGEDLLQGGRRIPNDQLKYKPNKRGNAPTGNDGHPVELHHRNQTPDGPLDEMSRTDHRLGDNYKKNHPNTGQDESLIDRKEFEKQRREHWEREWDEGRFDDLPEKPKKGKGKGKGKGKCKCK
ncbi:MAG: RHS repeat-associated core domain-containing protein [Bacteroidota bacterium]